MASAAAKYQQEDTGDASGRRSQKDCADASRQYVRKIRQYPILSVEWIALLDVLNQLSRLIRVEGRMLPNTLVTETQGRDKESDGTLWDQEQNETAIRVLVEEAKVNLCLRIMNDYKKWSYDEQLKASTVQGAIQEFNYPEVQIEQKLQQFEECLGLLLWRALIHVETLQLMDIPLLIEHCTMVLEQAARSDAPARTKNQETIVLYYFSSLMKHAEALNNAELLAKTRETRLIHLAADRVLKHVDEYALDLITAVAYGFAALCDNEDFGASSGLFFQETAGDADGGRGRFLELGEKITGMVIASNTDKKKDVRPLLDFCNKLKRELSR